MSVPAKSCLWKIESDRDCNACLFIQSSPEIYSPHSNLESSFNIQHVQKTILLLDLVIILFEYQCSRHLLLLCFVFYSSSFWRGVLLRFPPLGHLQGKPGDLLPTMLEIK